MRGLHTKWNRPVVIFQPTPPPFTLYKIKRYIVREPVVGKPDVGKPEAGKPDIGLREPVT